MTYRDTVMFLLSGVLGNRSMSLRLLEAAAERDGKSDSVMWFTPDDYRRFRAPALLRRASTLETAYVARRKLAAYGAAEPSVIFVNGYELAVAARSRFRAARLVAALDGTPALVARLQALVGGPRYRKWAKLPLTMLQHAQFARLARRVSHWFPISNWCRDSLVVDYGVAQSLCTVTRAPQPRVATMESLRVQPNERPRLLFVGNDAERKGAKVLLQAFADRLRTQFELTIVSNDPQVATWTMPQGAVHLSGLTDPSDIRQVYHSHDLLVLPTRYDLYPNVICEGLSQGIPFLATALPGISEIAAESGAGWTCGSGAGLVEIETAIREIFLKPDQYARARRNALDYANRLLRLELLSTALRKVLADVRSGRAPIE
jgi:glycosyltransferase involved in cell wall biosynthesis